MTLAFTLEKCKTKASYSAKLPNRVTLNLENIAKNFEVVLTTPVLIIVKCEGVEVIVHGYGELLFKDCKDLELMREIAERVYELGLKE